MKEKCIDCKYSRQCFTVKQINPECCLKDRENEKKDEIKVNKSNKSITFTNNGIAFSQFGVADEILDLIINLQEKLKVSQTNEETYRLEMQDITKILGLDEHTTFDEVKEYATNLQEEKDDAIQCLKYYEETHFIKPAINNTKLTMELANAYMVDINNLQQENKELKKKITFNEKSRRKMQQSLMEQIEQLKEENEFLKLDNPEMNMEHFRIIKENKRKIDNLREENKRLKGELENKLTPNELVSMLNQELVRQNKNYKSRNEKAIEDIDLVIELIKQQPTEDDTWILNRLNGFKYLLQGENK